MSLTKRYLESQPEFQSNDALLETAIRDIERAARRLSRIENLCELTIGDVAEIAKSLNRAALRLALARQENEPDFNQKGFGDTFPNNAKAFTFKNERIFENEK